MEYKKPNKMISLGKLGVSVTGMAIGFTYEYIKKKILAILERK